MAQIKVFKLPDLGEGLPDATILEWHVEEGDTIQRDESLASMETAKAVVEVPAPYTGRIVKLHGAAGDVIETGSPLVEFDVGAPAEGSASPAAPEQTPATQPEPPKPEAHAATVVGTIDADSRAWVERPSSAGGARAVPAVRALAHKLKVDLASVTPSGAGGVVTMDDVKRAAAGAPAAAAPVAAAPAARAPAAPAPVADKAQPLTGVRRNMARVMTAARAVMATTTTDDADIHAWIGKQDVTVRLVRAVVAACKASPGLNAWFDGDRLTRTLHSRVDLGMAVDTEDGLFVPVLRGAQALDAGATRSALDRLRGQVLDRSIPASELEGATITLSNYGTLGGGRYATPVVVPPTVAIVGTGRAHDDVVAVLGGLEVHRRIPISLTFDHRAATGGDAARFMNALVADLELPQ